MFCGEVKVYLGVGNVLQRSKGLAKEQKGFVKK